MASNMTSGQIPSDLPSYYQPLSLRLYQTMKDIGATVDMRNIMMDHSINREILLTTSFQAIKPRLAFYRFGSSYEGTTTIGMNSDVDEVDILKNLPVVIECSNYPVGKCLLLVQDHTTPAGYCKVQLVHNGIPQVCEYFDLTNEPFFESMYCNIFTSCVDKHNRLVCTFKLSPDHSLPFHERHGPVMTTNCTATMKGGDAVFAFECNI